MITHYDLFAGIGGFSYALDQVFYDQEIKHIFCEWEAFPTAVLKKHWPDGTYYGDIADLVDDTKRNGKGRKVGGGVGKEKKVQGVDWKKDDTTRRACGTTLSIVTGGFPCQPFSHAGRRKGTADDRYKWPEMFAVIQNVQPDWVIAENVRGFATWNDGMVLERTCADLESEGYEVQPFIIPACAVQAPHQRERVWIVAHNGCERREQGSDQDIQSESQESEWTNNGSSSIGWDRDWREVALTTCHDGVDDGLPREMDGVTISAARHRKERLKACGNAIVPQVAMEIFKAIKHEYNK